MVIKHMKRCTVSFVIRELQITMWYTTTYRWEWLKKKKNPKYQLLGRTRVLFIILRKFPSIPSLLSFALFSFFFFFFFNVNGCWNFTKCGFTCSCKKEYREIYILFTQFPRTLLLAQLCLTLCNPMDCSPPSSSVHGIFQARNTGVGCHFLLQEIFPTQGSNPYLLHLWHWRMDGFFTTGPPGKPALPMPPYGNSSQNTKTGLPWWLRGKEFAHQCRRLEFDPWLRKILHAAEQLSLLATTTEPMCRNYWSSVPLSLCSTTKEAAETRSLRNAMKSSPGSLQLQKSLHSNKDPA